MGYRTIVIREKSRLSYKNNYLTIKNDNINRVFIDEINVLIIESNQITLTAYLINELVKKKVKLIFCNEYRNPSAELIPYYGSHNSSKKIKNQIAWTEGRKDDCWLKILVLKIHTQARLLRKLGFDNHQSLLNYLNYISYKDQNNIEAHVSKEYYLSLFGSDFRRREASEINAALNYGFAIMASFISRELVAQGYLTQLGVNHRNEFNFYNFTYDLIEPFRFIVDELVFNNIETDFDKDYKLKLINILNQKVKINNKMYYLTNAIELYIRSVIEYLNEESEDILFLDLDYIL